MATISDGRAAQFLVGLGCGLLMWSVGTACASELKAIDRLPGSCEESPFGPGEYQRDLSVGGGKRSYLIHVPPSYRSGERMPVVLNFHGGGGNPSSQVELTGMNDTADRAGFIAVYPAGSGRLKKFLTFNAGSCCGFARDQKVDDVGFVEALLDDLAKIVCVDAARVYATGHSNGAMMSYRLACDLSDRIAAVAAVAGPMGIEDCRPSRPVPILHFHGTADQCAPIAGGAGKSKDAGTFRSVDSSVSQWMKINGCDGRSTISYQKANVTCATHGGCRDGGEVTLCTIAGGGHAWPGGRKYPAEKICGGTLSQEVSANELMWEFFERHPMPDRDGQRPRDGGRRVEPEKIEPERP
ncbi:MAG: hypothetical protein MUE90_03330 [Thermoanaerobaculales bacterium]|jgi:polyhydroxybutyrate depolymerase|nr:hypothetical protein [Thermoanaerobaculales bacterium]